MIDERIIGLLLDVEKAVSVLSGYVHGELAQNDSEPIIHFDESEVIKSEKTELSVSTDIKNKHIQIDFTKQELKKMRKDFAKKYINGGLVFSVRAKGNVYEVRYRRDGVNLSASSKSLSEAKEKMKELLARVYTKIEAEQPVKVKKTAVEYFNWYIDEVKAPKCNLDYVRNLRGYVAKHLAPTFSDRPLCDVPYSDLQRLVNDLTSAGKFRTAKGIRTLMIEVYRSAVYDGEIKVNHAERITPIVYDEKHGRALTIEEEKEALKRILQSGSAHRNDFLILLFAGLRPCELKTVSFSGDFLIVQCAKTRTGTTKTRKVPMTPMFKRYVDVTVPICPVLTRQLEKSLKVIFGDQIRAYDFRHTFITRAQECGVPQEVVQAWVGHSSKTLMGRTYTHFSDDYLLKMAALVTY